MGSLLYLDVCCLKRPFDDQRAPRVQLETTAIAALIEQAETGKIRLVRSPAHDFENERNPREDRRLATALWLDGAHVDVPLTSRAEARARQFADLGFGALDALHVALAEEAGASWFATTDDHLIGLGRRHGDAIRVPIVSPIHALESILGERA